jgi:hypothetical protein
MNNHPITPQALRGYPIDHELLRANRAQRGPRRRLAALRAVATWLRRPQR